VAGESPLFVDQADIPSHADITTLGTALAQQNQLYELMAITAAYTGLRWGELAALTHPQADPATRTVTIDRKIIEIGGTLHLEPPKGRKKRSTIYPRTTPAGYPLADRLAARITAARAGQAAGTTPHGLLFPSPPRHLVALLQLHPPHPGPRLPGGRLATRPRHQMDLAQPPPRLLHHRPVHLVHRPRRRLPPGRPRQHPHHLGHVHRHHCRHPPPRPHRHRLTNPTTNARAWAGQSPRYAQYS